MKNAFYIEKLNCKYENTTVFSAKDIEIPKGKLTVIIGPSGSGKSTFIEALGLMNKTMSDDSKVYYDSEGKYSRIIEQNRDPKGINLNALWTKTDEKGKGILRRMFRSLVHFLTGQDRKKRIARNEIRGTGYSFVFQDTYLMPNFSAIDNIALTDLLKESKLHESYHKIIHGLVKNLNLQNLYFKNPPSEYSGGERQRMAFGRGIFPDYEVLFGDEPTGNLDQHNAEEVLKYVKESIKSKPNRCAILVTHSIDLALQFADRIIVLTPREKVESKKTYTVLKNFIFDRAYWENDDEDSSQNVDEDFVSFRDKIIFLIDSDKGDYVIDLSKEIMDSNEVDYDQIFKKYINLPVDKKFDSDELIKKVVCEIPKQKVREAIVHKFKDSNSLEIQCKPISDFWDHERNIVSNLLFLFHRVILRLFKILIKGEISILKKITKNHKNLKPDFLGIYVYNELKEFFGKQFPWNLIFVLFIQFLIFYLIGTANGILDFVSKQDKNPFVKVINVTSSYTGIKNYMENVQKVINIKDYGIEAITYFTQATTQFYPVNERPDSISQVDFYSPADINKQNLQAVSMRSLQPNDPLRGYLLTTSALRPSGTDFSGDNDFSVIVTRNYLQRLNQKDSTFIIRAINNSDHKYWQPLPICGIVDQLPGDADMVCLDNLWSSIYNDNNWDYVKNRLVFFVKIDSSLINSFQDTLVKEIYEIGKANSIPIETKDIYDPLLFNTIKSVTTEPLQNIKDLFEIQISAPGITKTNSELVYNTLMKRKSFITYLNDNKIPLERVQLSYLSSLASGGSITYNDANMSVDNFKRIYEFSDKVYKISGIRLDMAKIERIRTYRIVASVTIMLSAFLIVFSILIITILLSNILSNHLNKIRKNIGLLMAFGVSTKVIYQCIMGTFIALTLIGGLGLSYIIGDLMHLNKFIFERSTGFILPNFTGFNISWAYISNSYSILKYITNPTIITIVLMMGFNLIRFNIIINKIFKETPGNLIYDKSNKG